MGGGDEVSGNGTTLPAAHLFPLPLPAPRTIPQANAVSERNLLLSPIWNSTHINIFFIFAEKK
jgi:hypothetical protein